MADMSEKAVLSLAGRPTMTQQQSGQRIIVAGPTAPLPSERIFAIKPTKFNSEPLDLRCEWMDCKFQTTVMQSYMEHVSSHVPAVEVQVHDATDIQVLLFCRWQACPWKTDKKAEDLQRHLYLHAYHTKLKCIGINTRARSGFNQCKADSANRNILPDLAENLVCAWNKCTQTFINIQSYYDHIKAHCEDNPKGKNVNGGIPCKWTGCSSSFANITKLKDHMRSHTQEKLLACPTCGGLFSNRTRFFDHCRRQVIETEEVNFVCDVCMKAFSTARLLRDHIKSHINTYRCPNCEMSCSSPSALNAHILYRHSKDKPYPCQQCSHSAKTYSDLVRHVKIHSKPIYRCEETDCTFEAKSTTSLAHHYEKSHGFLNAARYVCHLCDKRYNRGFDLTKHLLKIHKLQLPSGHTRFRYKIHSDGCYRLLTLRYESVDMPGTEAGLNLNGVGDIKVEMVLPH